MVEVFYVIFCLWFLYAVILTAGEDEKRKHPRSQRKETDMFK